MFYAITTYYSFSKETGFMLKTISDIINVKLQDNQKLYIVSSCYIKETI
jgi:hypothetical protein